MSQEQLFASFVLDRSQDLEIALKAEQVAEATTIQGTIRTLPGGVDFLEGIMHLRDDVIPIINLKRRLGLEPCDYRDDAKVAVVSLHHQRFGLLFDDIKEVFRAEAGLISPISAALQTSDRVISSLIKLENGRRMVELLDLKHLFEQDLVDLQDQLETSRQTAASGPPVTYARYVIFICAGQQYGVAVENAREITFCTNISDLFRTGMIEGAIELRGRTIPVLSARALLSSQHAQDGRRAEDERILVLSDDDCVIGIVVDQVVDIMTVGSDRVLPFPSGQDGNVTGLFSRPTGENVILLNIRNLICDQIDSIKSMARINGSDRDGDAKKNEATQRQQRTTHHLITENCYLIFSIGKRFAIEIKDVREIIEATGIMRVPGADGFSTGVINLRGEVVPVIDLRCFLHYQDREDGETGRLIICSGHGKTVALQVDHIVTIYKQEQYHATPSLNPQLNDRRDTLDRLIEYFDLNGLKEHVLVINTHNLIRHHLSSEPAGEPVISRGNDYDS